MFEITKVVKFVEPTKSHSYLSPLTSYLSTKKEHPVRLDALFSLCLGQGLLAEFCTCFEFNNLASRDLDFLLSARVDTCASLFLNY